MCRKRLGSAVYVLCYLHLRHLLNGSLFLALHPTSVGWFRNQIQALCGQVLIFSGFSKNSRVSKHCLMDASLFVFVKTDSSARPCYLLFSLLLLNEGRSVSRLVGGLPKCALSVLGFYVSIHSDTMLIIFCQKGLLSNYYRFDALPSPHVPKACWEWVPAASCSCLFHVLCSGLLATGVQRWKRCACISASQVHNCSFMKI